MSKTTHFSIFAALGAVALFLASPADAARSYSIQTGADLAEVCAAPADANAITDGERHRLNICGSYIQGFLGHYAMARSKMSEPDFCLPPEGVAADRVRLLLLALLDQKPQISDLPANVDLATSLAWGYPCNGAGAR